MSGMPNRLRIRDGQLEMIDGSDPAEYLRSRNNLADDTHIVILPRDVALSLQRDAEAFKLMNLLADERFALCA